MVEPFAGSSRLSETSLEAFCDALTASESFDSAAEQLLSAMLAIARDALAESDLAERGRVLRAFLHFRPIGYRGLVGLSADSEPLPEAALASNLRPSNTAWNFVSRGETVRIDVNDRSLHCSQSNITHDFEGMDTEPAQKDTLAELEYRGCTHACVIPLKHVGARPVGMISVEADCPGAIGREFIWSRCEPAFERLAAIAAPYLTVLPHRTVPLEADPLRDELLPVIGQSMRPIVSLLAAFSVEEETLLIGGPTGTGKSRIARWCHSRSKRTKGPFEVVDLLNVPEDMQSAELNGWKRGAFTGAVSDRDGYVSRADGGTLFIDEVDKLSLSAQASLLNLIENRRYRVLGDTGPERSADVRFIIGTNMDLATLVEEKTFREDLFYRINVVPVTLPSLRERADEIGDWARFMIQRRHAEAAMEGGADLSEAAVRTLERFSWPGNLRQLDNVLRRAFVLSGMEKKGLSLTIDQEHIHAALALGATPKSESVMGAFKNAAELYVAEVMREGSNGLDLDAPLGVQGLVLLTAIKALGSREDAFRLLGGDSLVRGRNHHKALKRHLEKTHQLYAALGEQPDSDLTEELS